MLKLLILLTSLLILSGCSKDISSTGVHPYNIKNNQLIQNLETLTFDSVKVFSFNCKKVSWNDPGYLIDSANLYYKNRKMYSEEGRVLLVKDTKNVINILKKSYQDRYSSFTVSPYSPTMGIAFFDDGEVKAHLDISTETSKVYLEIFENGKIIYQYDWITMGVNKRKVFNEICKKYELKCCR